MEGGVLAAAPRASFGASSCRCRCSPKLPNGGLVVPWPSLFSSSSLSRPRGESGLVSSWSMYCAVQHAAKGRSVGALVS